MEDNITKWSHIILTIIMLGIVIIVGTYAWLSYQTNHTAMVLTIGEINNVQVTLSPYQIKASILPQVTYTSDNYTSITAVNNSISYKIIRFYYKINNIDNELISSDFKYTIERSTNGTTYSEYKTGNFSSATSGGELTILEEKIPGNNTTYYYKVYIWLDGSNSGQSYMQGKSFNGELNASIESSMATLTTGVEFNKKIKSLAGTNISSTENGYDVIDTNIRYITKANELPQNINFTNDNIISTNDSKFPIYTWYDNNTIYYFSNAETIYINSNSSRMFFNMTKVEHIDINTINTSNMNSANYMFYNCQKLASIDLSNFDTKNVSSLSSMFEKSYFTSLDLSSFDTSNVSQMAFMFAYSTEIESITFGTNFDTSKVINMWSMFNSCAKLKQLNLSSFNVEKVQSMKRMFYGCTKITSLDLSSFEMKDVNDTEDFISNMQSLQELKTPSMYPSDNSITINLPVTLYDTSNNAYTSLNNTSPTNTWLRTNN